MRCNAYQKDKTGENIRGKNRKLNMKTKLKFLVVGLFWLVITQSVQAQGTAFNYQGLLSSAANPANGIYDFRFRLASDPLGNNFIGGPFLTNGIVVTNGLFLTAVDFGTGIYNGSNYWLEVDVRTNGAGAYTELSPLQAFTPTPYAVFAENAGNAVSAANVVTYTAGPGLELAGSQFEADFSTNGVSTLVSRDDHTHFAANWSGTTPGAGLTIYNQDASSYYSSGIYGVDSSTYGYGVYGQQGTGSGYASRPAGIAGNGTDWYGVSASSLSNSAIIADSYNAAAIYAWSHGASGGYGLYSTSDSSDGIVGNSSATNGSFYGVYGTANSTSGRGVYGYTYAGSGSTYGVYGEAASSSGVGVFGVADSGSGTTYGVYGQVYSPSGEAVYGLNGSGTGIEGDGQTGVYGISAVTEGNGIIGECDAGPSAYGVWGKSTSGYAGYFSGNVYVNGNLGVSGTLSKAAGSFKIDDPIDPTNKFLYHSFVESPDMKNIYDGIVLLDAQGEASVKLPAWFGALNQDFRYQLTAVGSPGPQLYIAQEVQDNQFKIAGGTPGGKVSWQVTGIRHDPYANAHRIPVEQEKPTAERGTYLHGAEYGVPQLTTHEIKPAK
jgi:hypothetical protein